MIFLLTDRLAIIMSSLIISSVGEFRHDRKSRGGYKDNISDGKVAEKMECQYENGNVTFTTGHFSTYAIMYEGSESGSGLSPMVFVAIGAVIVLAVAGAAYFFIRKH